MKLLLQHPHGEDDISGVMTSLREMLPALAALPGLEVRLLSTKTSSWRAQLQATVWSDAVLLNSNAMWINACARLSGRRTLLKLHYPQYQTVHWQYTPMSFAGRLLVEVRHLLGLTASARYIAESLARLLLRTMVALTAWRVCACSRFCAEQAALPRGVGVLRNPLAVTAGRPPRTAADLDRPLRFVFVGRLATEKGWDTLLDATARLAAEGRNFRVDIAGDGPDFAAARQRVEAAGLQDVVVLHGRLAPDDARALFKGALAAVVPSRFQEPAGYVAVEAAADQVAAIVSCVGGLPETAGDICPSFEAGSAGELQRLMAHGLDDVDSCLRIGRAAYLRACTEFSPAAIVGQLLDMLEGRR